MKIRRKIGAGDIMAMHDKHLQKQFAKTIRKQFAETIGAQNAAKKPAKKPKKGGGKK